MTPAKIKDFIEANAPVQSFGVGSYIASAKSNPFNADIHEIDGRPMARRGKIPGVTQNPRLDRII